MLIKDTVTKMNSSERSNTARKRSKFNAKTCGSVSHRFEIIKRFKKKKLSPEFKGQSSNLKQAEKLCRNEKTLTLKWLR